MIYHIYIYIYIYTPPYACIFMNQIETKFLRTQSHQSLVWFRYIDDIFLFVLTGKKEFMADFNAFNPDIKLTYESWKKKYYVFRS